MMVPPRFWLLFGFCTWHLSAARAEPLPADKFSPGAYGMEKLEPVMPKPPEAPPAAASLRETREVRVERRDIVLQRVGMVELPFGCRLLSHGCKVTSGDPKPRGDLQWITDGDRTSTAGREVVLAPGKQWVQLDLGSSYDVHCVWVWHYHRGPMIVRGMKVEVADEETGPWRLIYTVEPDACCASSLYEEAHTGYPITMPRREMAPARYVRLWSEGSDDLPDNYYAEVAVYGKLHSPKPADYFRPPRAGEVKLEPELPRPLSTGSASPPPGVKWDGPESFSDLRKRVDNVRIAEGCRLLSLNCPVKVSDKAPLGDPAVITDGIRVSEQANMLDLAPGRQWVVIDLGARREIHCLWLWMNYLIPWVACENIIVLVTDNPDEPGNANGTYVFNNDRDGSEGFGKGTDPEWAETNYGRPITFPPLKARYVKVWMNGRNVDGLNILTEIAVYGKDIAASPPRVGEKRPANPDNLELVGKIREHIIKTSTETEAAQMKAYTGKVPRTQDASYQMVPIPGGEFLLGSREGEKERRADEGPQVPVKIDPFWMGAREVTWDECSQFILTPQPRYRDGAVKGDIGGMTTVDAVSGPTSPYIDMTYGMGEKGYPAIGLTEHTALKYCQWLSAQTGHFYRLPTEAEWEYAARAGSKIAWFFGNIPDRLGEYAWFADNSEVDHEPTTHPAGQKKPSPWGLYDIYGNAAEWTLDEYSADWYARLAGMENRANPFHQPVLRYPRAVRGGSYQDKAADCRSSSRRGSDRLWKVGDSNSPKSLWYHTDAQFVGFRIVRPLKVPSAEEMQRIWNLGAVGDDD